MVDNVTRNITNNNTNIKDMADLDNVKFSFVENKKQMSNFTLDAGVKRAFKLEVIKNGDIMSKVIETLMASYVVKSQQLHAEAEAKTKK